MWKRTLFLLVLPLTAALLSAVPVAASGKTERSLTIYNQDLALVREVRSVRLSQGLQEFRLDDVPARVEPSSVRLRSLTAPDSVRLYEQRFEFDLTGTERLLEKYIGRRIVVTLEEGGTCRGTLLGAGGGDALLKLEDGTIEVIKADRLVTLRFPSLPGGLVTRPALAWLLECTRPGRHQAEISYLTHGIEWKAEYTASINEAGDHLELAGWAWIENRSGLSFPDVRISLLAGDLHRVELPPYRARSGMRKRVAMMAAESAPETGFREASLSEYHVYHLDRTVTLKDREAKQVALFAPATVKAAKAFVYDGSVEPRKVRVDIVFQNTRAAGLGMPLPAGRVRLYKAAAGGPVFLGEDRVGHVPKGEEVKVHMGYAFDLSGKRTVLETRQIGKRSRQEKVAIRLKNHKKEPVTVTVVEHFRGDWRFVGKTPPIRRREAYKVEFDLPVPAEGEKGFTYQVLYQW